MSFPFAPPICTTTLTSPISVKLSYFSYVLVTLFFFPLSFRFLFNNDRVGIKYSTSYLDFVRPLFRLCYLYRDTFGRRFLLLGLL